LSCVSRILCATLLLTPLPGAALARDKIVDEVKVGVLAHDIGLFDRHAESGADFNGEILFVSPGFLSVIGAPRPHLGLEVNSDGNTDNAYFGLTWGLRLVPAILGHSDALTLYGSLGGAVNDGFHDGAPPGRKDLGSPILFRESVELGYQLTPVTSVSLLLDHVSNANLARHNGGITNLGVRVGFKF
jgi:lipid A 3-O-deacylase